MRSGQKPRLFPTLVLGCTLVHFVGCIPARIPTSLASCSDHCRVRHKPTVLLLENPSDDAAMSVGHQYLFGIIPFTRLSVDRTALATESAHQILLDSGYDVYRSDESIGRAASDLLRPHLVISSQLVDLRVNAYDAIFFRIVDIDGLLELHLLGREEKRLRIPFRHHSYRRQAPISILSYELESCLRKALAEVRIPAAHRRQESTCPSAAGPIALLLRPKIALPVGATNLTERELERRVALGFERSLRTAGLSVITSPAPDIVRMPCSGEHVLWSVRPTLTGIAALESDSLSLQLGMEVANITNGEERQPLRRSRLGGALSDGILSAEALDETVTRLANLLLNESKGVASR